MLIRVYPPAPLLQVFNFSLRFGQLVWAFICLSVDPPAPLLQVFNFSLRFGQLGLDFYLPLRKPACAVVAGYRFGLRKEASKFKINRKPERNGMERSPGAIN